MLFRSIEQLKAMYNTYLTYASKGIITSSMPVGAGGIAEALSLMAIGNDIGVDINTKEDLFSRGYGSIVIEAKEKIEEKDFLLLGITTSKPSLVINDNEVNLTDVKKSWLNESVELYPTSVTKSDAVVDAISFDAEKTFTGPVVDEVKVFVPVFPGTNCEYDSIRAFNLAGAKTTHMVFKNQTEQDIVESVDEMVKHINESNIIMLSGGFSSGDEPDGSAKFIVNILHNEKVKEAVHNFLDRDGLMLGICNGFQALVKSGLLPYGRITELSENSPTLTKNDINRHVSHIATTRVASNNSPWLQGLELGELHKVAVSHGEGKFVVDEGGLEELINNGQIAFQYTDLTGVPTMDGNYNVNGSVYAIEGITSKCGRILGKMGHSERFGENIHKNIPGNKVQSIFENGVNYFRGE